MKKLGFGFMRLPLKGIIPTMVNINKVNPMVDLFIDSGFTYFDTAYIYHGMRSEPTVKKTVTERYDRCAFTLATKMPLSPILLRNTNDRDKIFEKQLTKCGVDYFDYYLLHNINARTKDFAEKINGFEFLQENKKAGRIINGGFSFHDSAELLDEVLTEHPEVDFVQLQINYLDWESEGVQSRKCYETAVRHGKKVIVMEPVKGGTLAKIPKEAEKLFKDYNPDASTVSWAIRFAASLDGVINVLSGMSNLAQMKDNVSYMTDFKPLNDDEREIINKAVSIIQQSITIPCTNCGYCVDGCPKKIAIPKCFALYNAEMQEDNKLFSTQRIYYKNMIRRSGKASDCIGCGQCEKACPQHLNITSYLKDVSKTFGK